MREVLKERVCCGGHAGHPPDPKHTWVTENWFDDLPAAGITGEVGAT